MFLHSHALDPRPFQAPGPLPNLAPNLSVNLWGEWCAARIARLPPAGYPAAAREGQSADGGGEAPAGAARSPATAGRAA
ncbi:hypothetical protein VQH23_09355 [Pararoseomonas sp. SCSIO 73927]|uniref:hypothetical protein n=1 Tax=Pararoseomonas sp. SCSIO 73927 TaxID=3114537 RepID=UPI0030D17DD8